MPDGRMQKQRSRPAFLALDYPEINHGYQPKVWVIVYDDYDRVTPHGSDSARLAFLDAKAGHLPVVDILLDLDASASVELRHATTPNTVSSSGPTKWSNIT